MKKDNSFLRNVVTDVLQKHKNLGKLIFIVPSKRAGAFLKQHLIDLTENDTYIAPRIVSIEDFVEEISRLIPIDNTQTLFEFYHTYLHTFPEKEKEDFENFISWGQTLIHDFNEIDRYCIDHNSIFTYLSRITELKHWYLQKEKTKLVKNYINFWEQLLDYYNAFKAQLLNKRIAYQGLAYRIASEKIQDYCDNTSNKYIIVGFNALNTAEQLIFQSLLNSNLAEIYWDTDSFFLNSSYHDASLFLKKYKNNWDYFKKNPFHWVENSFSENKNITILGTPKNIGQAQTAGELLKKIPKEDLDKTALILADETLLSPVLSFLPDTIDALNITMGLSIKDVPISPFFEILFALQKNQKEGKYYYRQVKELLSLPVSQELLGNTTELLISFINHENIIYFNLDRFLEHHPDKDSHALNLLFQPWKTVDDSLSNCREVILLLKKKYSAKNNQLALEYLFHFNTLFNKLNTIYEEYGHIKSMSALYYIYKDLITQEKLDFIGEPYSGLQVMGMLESRCLDFDTVIITSMNEGILPAGKSNNSFIPYDLKRAYDLPTYKEKDAIYTYHFYRILQRAKNVYLIYNTENDGVGGGEKSRFLLQLDIDRRPHHVINNYIVTSENNSVTTENTEIKKTKQIIDILDEIAVKGFSPSALTTYIRNPLDFYYKYILKIKETEEVEETVAANTLGTIVHNTLENFYKPLEGQYLSTDHIDDMIIKIDKEVKKQFDKEYSGFNYSQGKNLLIFEVAKRYIKNFLKAEKDTLTQGQDIKIIAIESDLRAPVYVEELGKTIHIRGKVDRIDEINGVLRVVDYKSGRVTNTEVNIVDWDPIIEDYKFSKVVQVLAYAYMYFNDRQVQDPFEAGIISFRNLKGGFLKFGTKKSTYAKPDTFITPKVFEEYLNKIKQLIVELYDIDKPFIEKEI